MSGDGIERVLDLADQLQAIASEMRDGEQTLTTREQWTAYELLVSAAAHARGAAAQMTKHADRAVTPSSCTT